MAHELSQRKNCQITPIRLSPEAKKRIRLLAAEKDTSMAEMARKLLDMGLSSYEETLKTIPEKGRETA